MLYVDDRGNPDGSPAAFVHGFMSSNLQWELNIRRLGRELRMVLVEQPGHGRSPKPDDPTAYSPSVVVTELDDVRESLGIERWWLVGHSMGGALAIRYALTYPDRTCGLVVTNSRAVFGIGRESEVAATTPPAPIRESPQWDPRRVPYHPINAKRFPEGLKDRMVVEADAMPAHVSRHVAANAAGMRSADELHRLGVPTLLVNGVWEKRFQPFVEVARETIPDLSVVDLDGGHSINVEQPDAFDQAVLEFIRSRG